MKVAGFLIFSFPNKFALITNSTYVDIQMGGMYYF